MYKCPKCKSEISTDAQVNWKCASCKKLFKVSFSRLETVLERKQKGSNVSLIKCPSCGRDLDNGNEEISWSCLECGNRVTGDLMTFKERMNENAVMNKSKTNDRSKRVKEHYKSAIGSMLVIVALLVFAVSVISVFEGEIIVAIGGGILTLSLWGFGEIIQLLEDIRNKLYS